MAMTPADILSRYWGYPSFRPMQAEIIDSVLQGHDTLGLMATGGGKSITFQVPAMLLPGLTVVVTPLISLMKDQVDNLRSRGIRAGFMHAALTRRESRLLIDKCRLGDMKILYLSPEKLQSPNFRNELRHLPVSLIVVDEAHCISQWGYDFRPSYLQIATLRETFPDAPVLALTASATEAVAEDIRRQLRFGKDAATFRLTFDRDNLSYIVRNCEQKEPALVRILQRVAGCGIVYVRSRKRAAVIAELLAQAGISAEFYHAGLSAEEKNERQNRWKEGRTRIMVATTAFGMGIDKPDVRIVVHVDPPSSLEEYYQEAGRAGRDGKPAFAVSLVVAQTDKATLSRRLTTAFPPKEYLRDIYSKLCVYLGIGMGEGYQRLFELNLSHFCERYKLQPASADSALKLLSQSGYIDYVEEVSTRSRLMVLLRRDELYYLSLSPECERIFQREFHRLVARSHRAHHLRKHAAARTPRGDPLCAPQLVALCADAQLAAARGRSGVSARGLRVSPRGYEPPHRGHEALSLHRYRLPQQRVARVFRRKARRRGHVRPLRRVPLPLLAPFAHPRADTPCHRHGSAEQSRRPRPREHRLLPGHAHTRHRPGDSRDA